jgi:hypothetical protein
VEVESFSSPGFKSDFFKIEFMVFKWTILGIDNILLKDCSDPNLTTKKWKPTTTTNLNQFMATTKATNFKTKETTTKQQKQQQQRQTTTTTTTKKRTTTRRRTIKKTTTEIITKKIITSPFVRYSEEIIDYTIEPEKEPDVVPEVDLTIQTELETTTSAHITNSAFLVDYDALYTTESASKPFLQGHCYLFLFIVIF